MLPLAIGQFCCSPTYGRTMAVAQPTHHTKPNMQRHFFIFRSEVVVSLIAENPSPIGAFQYHSLLRLVKHKVSTLAAILVIRPRPMKLRQQLLSSSRRIVVKLGTGLLTDETHRLAPQRIAELVAQMAMLREQKHQVLLVSSGAIAAGMAELGLTARPRQLHELQAAAAIGQGKLMALYDAAFGKHSLSVAQVLLTHDDLKNRDRHLNARNTLETLLARGVIPIINENDTVAVDEIKFGDNDRLGALTATLIDADLLVILSHVEGLLDEDGNLISVVSSVTRDIEALAGGTDRVTSVGGMKSKIEAAKIVTRSGIP